MVKICKHISSSSASNTTSSGFIIPNSPPLPKSIKSPPYSLVISSSSPSGSIAIILCPFLILDLNKTFAAVDLPEPDVPNIIRFALFLLNSFLV